MENIVFNKENNYAKPQLFLGQRPGLFDTVNKHYPEIWKLYKTMKSLDWDENEFDYSSCVAEFKTCSPAVYDIMVKTLAYQWEADSVASRLSHLVGSVVSNSELWAAWQRIGDNECLIEGTEALTEEGWVDLKEVTENMRIAQYDLDGTISFVNPLRIVEKDYEGEVFQFTTQKGHVNQIVTPGHRMYLRHNKGNRHEIGLARDIDPSLGAHSTGKSFVVGGKLIGDDNELTAMERLLIAVQADGSVSERYTGELCGTIPVWFGFSKERKIDRLLSLCAEAKVGVTELTGEPSRGNRKAQRRFKLSFPREFSPWLKNLDWFSLKGKSANWCKDFLSEVEKWDGHSTKNTGIVHTTSKQLAEVCQMAAVCCGHKTHWQEVEDNRSESFSNCFRVSWKDQDFHTTQNSKKISLPYKGKVRCVTVPSGLFLVRYKGAVSVTGNCVHAATYSEIVRNSFQNPKDILSEILSVEESFGRLEAVGKVFSDFYTTAHKYAVGVVDEDAYDKCFLFVVALLCLERIQFMASFAVTFTICDSGLFQPIGKAVQKIAQDELEVHVALDKEVLRVELATERGARAYVRNKDRIKQLLDEVVNNEIRWVDYLFSEGRELVGLNADLLRKWTLFCARDVYKFLDVESEHTLPRSNPLKLMEKWLDISKTQPSPQEQDNAQYKVGVIIRTDEGESFDVDF